MSSQQTASAVPFTAKALYNFVGNHEDELQFRKGDYLTVLQVVDGGWWEGQLQGHGSAQCSGPVGWFPANHIKIVSPDDLAQIKANPNVPKHVHSSSSPRENTMHSPENTPNTQKTSHYSLVDTGLYSLLESQMRFEDSLNNLLEKSLIPLGNSNILSAKDYDILCCNLHEITQLVKTLTKELTDACKLATSSSSSPSSQQGGKFAKQMCSFLSRYRNLLVVYCANHPLALRVISNHSSQLDSFAKASRSSLGAPASSSPSPAAGSGYSGTILDLTAAFSQPFRQIETYSGILREIKASISDSHPDYNQLTEAIRLSDKLVNELEEVRGLKEREMEILSARMDNWPRPINDPATATAPLSAIGPVLSMAAVWTTKPNSSSLAESYLLMFTDYVVIVQPTPDPKCYKCQHLIEMRELVAHAKDPASDAKSNHSSKYPLILIDQDGERYSVLFRLNQQRAQWVKMIGDQSAASSAISGSAALGPSNSPRPFLQSTSPLTGYPSQQHNVPAGSKGLSAVSSHARLRSSAAASHPSMSPQPPSHHPHAVSRPPPFMRNERSTGANHSPSSMGAGRCNGTAVTTGGFDITQLRPNPPMTPSELILCARQSNDAVKSPKVSRKKSNRKSEKIRAEELAELNSRKTLDCRSLDHDAKIFEVIEAYCQSSQNRMTLHSVADVNRQKVKTLVQPSRPLNAQLHNTVKTNKLYQFDPFFIDRNNLRQSKKDTIAPAYRYKVHPQRLTSFARDDNALIQRALTPLTFNQRYWHRNELNGGKKDNSRRILDGSKRRNAHSYQSQPIVNTSHAENKSTKLNRNNPHPARPPPPPPPFPFSSISSMGSSPELSACKNNNTAVRGPAQTSTPNIVTSVFRAPTHHYCGGTQMQVPPWMQWAGREENCVEATGEEELIRSSLSLLDVSNEAGLETTATTNTNCTNCSLETVHANVNNSNSLNNNYAYVPMLDPARPSPCKLIQAAAPKLKLISHKSDSCISKNRLSLLDCAVSSFNRSSRSNSSNITNDRAKDVQAFSNNAYCL